MRRRLLLPLALAPLLPSQDGSPATAFPSLEVFSQTTSEDPKVYEPALRQLTRQWKNSYAAMIFELASLLGGNNPVRERLLRFLSLRTGQDHGARTEAWQQWFWSLPYQPHPHYSIFKGLLYANLDPRMQAFFPADRLTPSRIRLDQVQWGGVRVNGIPPLVNPAFLPAAQASYLEDHHVIFGLVIHGDARAYPKRILAWHEMARDTVGGQPICLVYCTLCGTVIPYYPRNHRFGTSGLLYESSKLMFDEETNSLWSTLQGQPVIGPLAHSGQQLDFAHVVTTTWGEWRAAHPQSKVLSLATGHRRDYGEGVAYRDYFASGDLMFSVARQDARLRKKDEILALRLPGRQPLAISVRLLRKQPELTLTHEGSAIVIQTTPGGASSVLVDGQPFPAHRAFWFGWYTQFPNTALVR